VINTLFYTDDSSRVGLRGLLSYTDDPTRVDLIDYRVVLMMPQRVGLMLQQGHVPVMYMC